MALHETFTSNPQLAFLLGPARPDFGMGNTWFGSVSIWAGQILNPFSNTNPVVQVAVSGIPGVSAIQAEIFGTRTYDATGLASVDVEMIEWSLPGSSTVLARFTFATPTPFPLSVARFGGDWRFVDIVNEILGLGGTLQTAFENFMNGGDTLIGGAANDTLDGGNWEDVLDGGAGADNLRGGSGSDVFVYRTGDGVAGEIVDGGDGTDSFRAVGAAPNGGILQSSAVNLSFINFSSVEQLEVNGTEVVLNVGQVGGFGIQTIIGRSGVADQVTIGNANFFNVASLSLINWDLGQDRIAILGTGGADSVVGWIGNDVFVGYGGADTFNGGLGDDRMILLQGDLAPQDSFAGGSGNDVLQVDSTEISSLTDPPDTDLRGMTLLDVEVLDIVRGAIQVDGADFVGSVSGTVSSPITATTGFNRVIGNDSASTDTAIILQIELGSLLGIDLRTTVFEDWNDGFIENNLIRIIAGAQTQIIYGANEYSRIVAFAATNAVFIQAGTEVDEIIGSNQGDYILASGGDDVIEGMAGNDLIDAGIGQDLAYGGAGNDSIGGLDGNDSLYGGANDDLITAGVGSDLLDGGEGLDVLIGGAGADVIIGGGGFDFASYQGAAAGVRADLSNAATNSGEAAGDSYAGIEALQGSNHADTLVGDTQDNLLYGQNGNDLVLGGAGNDAIYGHSGDDVLIGGAGADRLDGDVGRDRVDYSDAAAGLRADLAAPAGNTGIAAGDSYFFIEDISGSAFTDSLLGDAGANMIWGANGNDALYGRDGADSLYGGEGNDLLYGGVGADRLDGGNGSRDRAMYSDSATGLRVDLLSPGANTGIAAGDTYLGVEDVFGSGGGDSLLGNAGGNILWGANGNDALYGRDGADSLYGGEGNDLLYGGVGADLLDGGAGARDRAMYSDSATGLRADLQLAATNTGIAAGDTYLGVEDLYGSNAGDSLLGNAGGNVIWGANGNDILYGRDGADTLYGGAGNDVLYGGNGLDRLEGGAGADSFVFNTALAGSVDTIADFSVIDDRILLENAIFTALTVAGPLAATAFATGAATTAAHRVIYNSATGQLLYDADGNGAGAAVHFATLSTGLAMTAADFLIV
jgi:Ca2+-binding RTX toxin-like protein